jgi:hypothetical protein
MASAGGIGSTAMSAPARAPKPWPAIPVRVIGPAPARAADDATTCAIALASGESLKAPVIVESTVPPDA